MKNAQVGTGANKHIITKNITIDNGMSLQDAQNLVVDTENSEKNSYAYYIDSQSIVYSTRILDYN